MNDSEMKAQLKKAQREMELLMWYSGLDEKRQVLLDSPLLRVREAVFELELREAEQLIPKTEVKTHANSTSGSTSTTRSAAS